MNEPIQFDRAKLTFAVQHLAPYCFSWCVYPGIRAAWTSNTTRCGYAVSAREARIDAEIAIERITGRWEKRCAMSQGGVR